MDKSQKITIIEIAILFVAGLFPLLWFREGSVLAFGDDFPLYLNAHKVFAAGPYLWSTDYLGYATPAPAYLIYQYLGAFLSTIGLSLSSVQIVMKVFLFLVAGLSMFYLTKKIYPQHRFAAFVAGFFYLFNFFVLLDVNNVGFIWTYAFLPLLLGLFFTAITATYQKDKKAANRHIIYFALVSVVAFSFASINPANVALLLIGLAVFAFYFVFKYRKQMRPFLLSLGKIVGATFPLNLWWLIPVLGSFIFSSSQTLNSQISIQAWAWTQDRASFLNLFRLNGYWNWLPEYYPFAKSYSNPILAMLVFVPFIIAGAALLFKSNKSRFNAYIMAIILCFLFLAKGLHNPFGQLNLFLYNTVPFMSIFREPVSKFTLLMMPFLALLVGYASDNFINLKVRFSLQPLQRRISSWLPGYLRQRRLLPRQVLAVVLLVIVFLISVYPLIDNTTNITIDGADFSSRIQIPSYWYQATDWVNSQQGNWRVLITPLDDFYQMPYTWGYYGTDQLINRLIEKPIISTDILNSYVVNPQTASTLQELNYAMRYGRASEFKALLNLLNVKYILQRNDVISNLPGRTTLPDGVLTSENAGAIMSPELMKDFFEKQSYLHLAKTFGDLDIYEFTGSLQSFYALSPVSLNQSNIAIRTTTTLQNEWNFADEEALSDWRFVAFDNTASTVSKRVQNGNFELSNTTGYYLKIESPYIQSQHENIYGIEFDSSGANTASMNVTVVQYSQNLTALDNYVGKNLNYGNFTNFSSECRFEPLQATNYFKIQIWLNIWNSTDHTGILQIADLNVSRSIHTLDTAGLDNLMNEAVQNQTASILKVQNLSPTKTVLSVNATHPFILATSQAFDKSWSATANGVQLKPVTLYLGLQGYEINKTGQLQITLEYRPQTWFYSASVISVASAIILLVLLAYVSRERLLQFVNKFKK